MSTNGATLVIDADTLRFITAINKGKKALQDLGDHSASAMGKLNHGMQRALIHAAGFATLGRTISQAAKDVAALEVKLGRESGSRNIDIASSAVALGSSNVQGLVGTIGRQRGGTTVDEQDKFFMSLAAKSKEGKRPGSGRTYSDQDILSLTGAYAKLGSYGFGEGGETLLTKLGQPQYRNNPNAAIAAALTERFGTTDMDSIVKNAPAQVRSELSTRNLERMSKLELLDTASGQTGRVGRATESTKELMELKHPYGWGIAKAANEVTSLLGVGAVTEAIGTGNVAIQHLEAIRTAAESTAKNSIRPNLGAGQEHKP